MIPSLLLAASLSTATVPEEDPPRLADSVRVAVHLLASELEVGRTYEVSVEVELDEGLSAGGAGLPAPLLQLDVPPSVRLEGKVLEGYTELSRNGFVDAPYERLLTELPARVSFELVAVPGAEETIGINLVGYVSAKDGRSGFLRRRLELPLEAGASALEMPPTRSSWGRGGELLQIGDRAPDFSLPRADGSELALSQLLGESKVLVVTYRAHW